MHSVSYAGIELTGALGDVVYLAIVVAFFTLAMGFVKACAAIAGPEPAGLTERGDGAELNGAGLEGTIDGDAGAAPTGPGGHPAAVQR